jgi:hypothetical protein
MGVGTKAESASTRFPNTEMFPPWQRRAYAGQLA